jgi:hypothetical protein
VVVVNNATCGGIDHGLYQEGSHADMFKQVEIEHICDGGRAHKNRKLNGPEAATRTVTGTQKETYFEIQEINPICSY